SPPGGCEGPEGASDSCAQRPPRPDRIDVAYVRPGGETVMAAMSEQEEDQVSIANVSGLAPRVFVHGLWLLASSWDRWRTLFEKAGYATVAPDWPDDAATVDEANAHPAVVARKSGGH